MTDPATRERFTTTARLMTLASQGREAGRRCNARRPDPLQAALRRRRADALRAGAPWEARVARQQLVVERGLHFWQEWDRRRQAARAAAKRRRERQQADQATLAQFATDQAKRAKAEQGSQAGPSRHWPPADSVPVPLQAAAAGAAGLPTRALQLSASRWLPDVQGQVLAEMSAILRYGVHSRVVAWEVAHATLRGHGVKVRPATAKERRARLCLEAGRCVCGPQSRSCRGLQVALGKAMAAWMGPGSRKTGMSENRRMVEEGFAIMHLLGAKLGQVTQSRWWHVSLMYFDQMRPTLLRLVPASQPAAADLAQEQAALVARDLADSLVAAGDQGRAQLTAAKSLCHNHPLWLTVWDAVEDLETDLAWSVEWWRVADVSSCEAQWQIEAVKAEGAPQQLWAGPTDLAACTAESDDASDAASGGGSGHGDSSPSARARRRRGAPAPTRRSGAAAVPSGAPDAATADTGRADSPARTATLDGDRVLSPVPAVSPGPALAAFPTGSPPAVPAPGPGGPGKLPAQPSLLERVKRSAAGEKTTCRARQGGELLEVLFTYRRPNSRVKFGSFQVTCYFHEPDRRINCRGRPYTLACRKEARVASPSGEAAALLKLRRWARAAPERDSRAAHQALPAQSGGESSSGEGAPSGEDGGARRSGARSSGGSSSRSSSSSSSSGSSSSGRRRVAVATAKSDPAAGATAAPVLARAAAVEGGLADSQAMAPADLGAAVPDPPAPGLIQEQPACWVCGEAHSEKSCPLWMLALRHSRAEDQATVRRRGAVAPRGPCGCQLPAQLVSIKDVPGDGDCLFHSLGLEIQSACPTAPRPPGVQAPFPGAAWRAFVISYVRSNPQAAVDGLTVEQLISSAAGQSVAEYCRIMASRDSWGGFLEASLLSQAWGQNLAIVLLGAMGNDWQVLAWTGDTGPTARIVYAAWFGNHWQRARLQRAGVQLVRAWRAESTG